MTRRAAVLLLALLALAAFPHRQSRAADVVPVQNPPKEESSLGLSYVKTHDATFVYVDPLAYLIPHAVRAFTNSLAWQKRMFEWMPSESTVARRSSSTVTLVPSRKSAANSRCS